MFVTLTFYRKFFLLAFFITVFGCWMIALDGKWTFAIFVFWTKVATNLILGIYQLIFYPDQFVLYYNLGHTKTRLFTNIFMIDLAIWLALSFMTVKFLL